MAKGPINDTPEGLAKLLGRHDNAKDQFDDPIHTEDGAVADPEAGEVPSGLHEAAMDMMAAVHGHDHKGLAKAMWNAKAIMDGPRDGEETEDPAGTWMIGED